MTNVYKWRCSVCWSPHHAGDPDYCNDCHERIYGERLRPDTRWER